MATKLDTEKTLFLGNEITRAGTVFGHIRKAVSELDKGEGVTYTDLEAHLLSNFKPTKSQSYDSSYVKSYVRDAVNKFGFLSHENLGVEYVETSPAEKKVAEVKVKPLTKAQISQNELLSFIRDKGEVSDVNDVDSTKITSETLMQEMKKKQKTVDNMVAALEKDNMVRTEVVEGSTYVFLTATGLARVNAATSPSVSGDGEAADSTATETTGYTDEA
jgi:hypothetical protein